LDNVPKVNGFFSLYPRESGELVSAIYGSTNLDVSRLADFMSVSQITGPGKFFDWEERKTFLPVITAGQAPVYLDDMDAMRALFRPGFDGAKQVLLPRPDEGHVTVRTRSAPQVVQTQFD